MTCKLTGGGAFLHVPKTGGSWVRAVLERNNLAGISLGHEHTQNHDEPWAFCVFRSPVAWWLSLWRFRMDTGFENMDGQHPLYPVNSWHDTDAAKFIIRAVEELPGFCGRLYESYARNAVYHLQTENLPEHMALLAEKEGLPGLDLDLPATNVSRARCHPYMGSLLAELWQTESAAFSLWKNAPGTLK